MTVDPPEQFNPPHAVVTKVGRVTWKIYISAGLSAYGPDGGWRRIGESRARRKAQRELRRYLARCEPMRFDVWPDDAPTDAS